MRLLLISLILSTLAFAAPSMRPSTYEAIQEANKLMDDKKYTQALELFNETLNDTSVNRHYDLAFLYNALGYYWIQKEDYNKAVEAYQKALDYKILPKTMQASIDLTLAQIYLQLGNFETCIAQLHTWHRAQETTELSAKLMMICEVSLDHKENGLLWCNKAIALREKPNISLYETKLSLELQLSRQKEAIQSLEFILEHFKPKLIYFKQLAYLYAQQNQEKKSVAILESAYQMKLLTKREDRIQLAQLLHQEGAPIKAATILSELSKEHPEDQKLLTYLSIVHMESKEHEKAIETLTTAYKRFKDEKIALQLAQLYAQNAQWDKTLFFTTKLTNNPNGILLRAIAFAQTDKIYQALSLFEKAAAFKQTRGSATIWLKHLKQ